MQKEGANEVGSLETEKTSNRVHICNICILCARKLCTKGDKDRPRWALASGESCQALGHLGWVGHMKVGHCGTIF